MAREDYGPIVTTESVSQARRIMSQREFDIVIINTPLKDELGINFAVEITDGSSCGVMLMVKSEMFDEINYKVQDCGVFTVPKPVNTEHQSYSLKMLCFHQGEASSHGAEAEDIRGETRGDQDR